MTVTELPTAAAARKSAEVRAQGVADVGPLRIEDMIALYRSILRALPDSTSRCIEVISANPGEGVSTTARGIVEAAAAVGNARVLLCDATPNMDEFKHFGVKYGGASLNDVAAGKAQLDRAVEPVPAKSFMLCALTDPGAGAHVAVDVDVLDPAFDAVRTHFDMVVIDAPPLNRGILGPALTKKADGVIMVVEAERTRVPVVTEGQRVIEINGGKLLGVVLNKRRFHVPAFIYRWI